MRLQRCRSPGSVHQAGALPAPFPTGRSPRRPGNRCQSRTASLPRPAPAGRWSRGPGSGTQRNTQEVQTSGASVAIKQGGSHTLTGKLIPHSAPSSTFYTSSLPYRGCRGPRTGPSF